MMSFAKNYTSPQPTDILGGRGSTPFNHPGNQLLRETIVDMLDDYNNHCNTRKDKHAIIHQMISSVQDNGGRFLKFDDAASQWYVAGLKEFRMKISHAFRDASIPNKVKCIDKMRSAKSKAAWEPIRIKVRRESLKKQDLQHEATLCNQLDEIISCSFQTTSLPIPKCDDTEPLKCRGRSPRVSFTFAFFSGPTSDVDAEYDPRASIARLDEMLAEFDASSFQDLDDILVDVFDEI